MCEIQEFGTTTSIIEIFGTRGLTPNRFRRRIRIEEYPPDTKMESQVDLLVREAH